MKTLTVPIALALSLAACQAPRPAPPDEAVYCSKCETVWIQVPDFDDPYAMSTTSAKSMECPDCRSAVATFFSTGKLRHECTSCGTLVHCTRH
jgi:hypothetical protein